MIGLILSFLVLGAVIYSDGFIAPYAVSVVFNFLFWWYVVTSVPKFLFAVLFIFLMTIGGTATGADLAQSRVGKLFGFYGIGLAFGGVSTAVCIFAFASNIFFILGAYLIQSSVYVDSLILSSGSYDYSQTVLGVIAILLGLYLQKHYRPKFTIKTRT